MDKSELCALLAPYMQMKVYGQNNCILYNEDSYYWLLDDGPGEEQFYHWQCMKSGKKSDSFYFNSTKTKDNAIATLKQLIGE